MSAITIKEHILNDVKISLINQELLQTKSEAIVNPTNDKLLHVAGLSGKICFAAGNELQIDSYE